MMSKFTYRTLIWVIVVLLATNLSMGISFLYHKQQDKKFMEKLENTSMKVPSERRARFFREQLNLDEEQLGEFRELNRNYNRAAWEITHRLEELRIDMVKELGKKNSDKKALKVISEQIGELHKNLKNKTIGYYLGMENVCNNKQREKLNDIFISMLKKNENISLPKYGGQRGNRLR
jgi:Spy/CpxP family protein refolding chaperone